MNEESFHKTLETKETWFWSRSRQELWHKDVYKRQLRNKARKLIIPLGDAIEVILAKGPDVTTYLKNGVVDLGIVGSDVLDEQDDTSYEMLDLQTGKCQFILASLAGYDPKEGRRQRIGTKYPTITKQYFGAQDVEIIKIEGSVESVSYTHLAVYKRQLPQ